MSPSSKSSKVSSIYIPDDLLLNCLVRVSRLYYPTLSLVSKRFRSLLSSLELYETRTRLVCTESCLYLCVFLPGESHSVRWFTLSPRPIQISDPNPNPKPSCFAPYRKKEKNVLVSIPTSRSPFVERGSIIAVGCNIYKIGGYLNNGEPSSNVFFMDCRSHTWHEAPSMGVARKYPLVSVLDGKIYVVEGLKEFHSSNLIIECFNPKTRKWEDVVGKLYLYEDKNVVYNPKENRWDVVGWMSFSNRYSYFSCVIDNVVYHSFDGWSGKIMWYDSEERFGRVLKGLEKLPTSNGRCFKLVNNGGKIAFIWEVDGCSNEKMIWCAEISLERRSKNEIYGNIDWCNVVLTVPKSSYFKQILSANV